MKPEQMQAEQLAKNQAVRAWAAQNGVGSKPASFPEKSRAPVKSRKNIKR